MRSNHSKYPKWGGASMSSTRRAVLRGAAALALTGLDALLVPSVRAKAVRVGERAPPATLVTLDGRRLATTDLLGHVVILTFWATWCVPCRQELPLLSDYASRHAAQGLSVLGFSLDTPERLPQVTQIARTLSFPVGLLDNSNAAGYGRMWKIPANFTIDGQGLLVDNGWNDKEATWTQERLDRIVTPLLKNST
ncbi:MAG TPA: TlpA disulfide reductase family protein [Steroidobacteraceae bacterium]|nr:TlpA disulfide reductase family protein [Steroidobacteraceae bacterium]